MDFMQEAIEQAKRALYIGEVPIGAVIVKDGKVISRAYNLKETTEDVTGHAEIIAIRKAEEVLNNWRLTGCSMYVTLEPCAMCASAIGQSRISELHIGTPDIDNGACGSVIDLLGGYCLNYKTKVYWKYNEKCSMLLSDFFKMRRK